MQLYDTNGIRYKNTNKKLFSDIYLIKLTKILLFFSIIITLILILQPTTVAQEPLQEIIVDRVQIVDKCMTIEKQPPDIKVHGTEYTFGASGKTFLQLIDQGLFIQNATCFLDIWFPNTTSKFIDNQLMIQHEQGIQFTPFIVPEVEGVYMVSASCLFVTENNFIFEENSLDRIDILVEVGTVLGDSIVLNSRFDSNQIEWSSTGGGGTKFAISNYTWISEDLFNVTDITLQWLGTDDTAGVTIEFEFFNFTNNIFMSLGPSKILNGNPLTLEYFTAPIPQDGISMSSGNGTVIVRFTASSGPTFSGVTDWMVLHGQVLTNQTNNNLRGSGELHVTISENEEILEEFNMAGLMLSFMILFITGTVMLFFANKIGLTFVTVILFIITLFGFNSIDQVGLLNASLMLAIISALKTLFLYTKMMRKGESISMF